jgi:type II secretory pathway component GspD/PulD (secretin)
VIQTLQKLSVAALILGSTVVAHAQDKEAKAPTPLKVQVVVARYEGDKKISSMPYVLSVNAGRKASLRMGTSVPIASTSFVPVASGGPNTNPLTSYNYRDIGTSIDCNTSALEDGRFVVDLSISDNAVEEQSRGNAVQLPSLRNFSTANSVVLKDGQSLQFTAAVDKITGIVTKVDVTLTVVK